MTTDDAAQRRPLKVKHRVPTEGSGMDGASLSRAKCDRTTPFGDSYDPLRLSDSPRTETGEVAAEE